MQLGFDIMAFYANIELYFFHIYSRNIIYSTQSFFSFYLIYSRDQNARNLIYFQETFATTILSLFAFPIGERTVGDNCDCILN